MQDKTLQGKVALVTGGANRLGACTAGLLHEAGMNLVIHYRSSAAAAQALRSRLEDDRPGSVALVKGNLQSVEEIERVGGEAVAAFGRLDVIVNNASAFYPTPFGEATPGHWEELMGSNLKAPFFLVQSAFSELKRNHGCVVNMVDIHGFSPPREYAVYATAKAGLISLTKALAKELAPEARANAIAPGAILWPEGDSDEAGQQAMVDATPLRRTGSPEEIAKAILFLVRDATFTTGHVIPVDGGRTA